MKYDLKYFLDYLTKDEDRRFDSNKMMLKVLLVNQNSDDALFNYYNFDDLHEVVSFLKLVVLPSVTISSVFSNEEEIIQLTCEKTDFLNLIEPFEIDNSLIKKYLNFYSEIESLEKKDVSIKDIIEITEDMNFTYGNGEEVFLIAEFSDCLSTYLNDIYNGYIKLEDDLDTLKEKFIDTDFSLEDFLNLKKDINYFDIDTLEDFLCQIPII